MAAAQLPLLVVDDSAELRALVAAYVQRDGRFRVVGEAQDGDEAIRLATRLRPAAIVLDCRMPGTGGIDALPALREAVPNAAIVMYSSMRADDVRERALAGGADGYVQKGQPVEDVLELLGRALAPGR